MRKHLARILQPIIAHYEKLVAMAMLGALLFAVVVLALRVSSVGRQQRGRLQVLNGLTPTYPEVPEVPEEPFQKALREIDHPFVLPPLGSTNALLVPEMRVSCVHPQCGRPIPFSAAVCAFCGKPQGETSTNTWKDTDQDGMPDAWEQQYRFDPNEASDAPKDADEDGWTNVEEYKAGEKGGKSTDPRDPKSCPPAWMFGRLIVLKTEAVAFKLKFMSSMVMPGGATNFQINYPERRHATFWKKIGEAVEGYTLISYVEKYEETVRPGVGGPRKSEVSELTLRAADGKEVVLVKNRETEEWERLAILRYLLEKDPAKRDVTVRAGRELEIGGKKYRVKEIDAGANTVILTEVESGKTIELGVSGARD